VNRDVTIPTAGVYNFEARVASAESAKTFHLEVAGVDVSGPMVVPDTGPGNTAWASITKKVTLPL
jgi:chitinase